MAEPKRPKWDGGVAVTKGKQSVNLVKTHVINLTPRIPAEEQAQHEANVTSLESRLAGKGSKLSAQKSSTSAQNNVMTILNSRVVGIRSIVKSSNATRDILDIFGVGAKIVTTVLGVASAADIIVTAYNQNKVWSNSIGILEKDIEELSTLTDSLFSADDTQLSNIYLRKAATMDLNTLHRAVEDKITKISALGVHEFELTNPAVAKLFADLIPSTAPKTTTTVTTPS